jgi:hypothetical protein
MYLRVVSSPSKKRESSPWIATLPLCAAYFLHE